MQIERTVIPGCLAGILLFCICSVVRSEPPAFAVVGGFGFNWLEPDTAQCARIAAADSKRFTQCEYHASGAFGLPLAYHTCTTTRDGEYLVFKSAAQCQEALETMQANGP